MEEMRVATIRIVVNDIAALKAHAAIASRLANECLSYEYLSGLAASRALRSSPGRKSKEEKRRIANDARPDFTPSSENWEPLSGNLRDTMRSEAKDLWARISRRVLAGHKTLQLFRADTGLRIRDKGVRLVRDGDWFRLELQLYPGRENNWASFPLYKFTEKKKQNFRFLDDPEIGEVGWLGKAANGEIKVRRCVIVFERDGVVKARLTWAKEFEAKSGVGLTAAIGPVGEDGRLYVRMDGPAYSFEERRRLKAMTHLVCLMRGMKDKFGAVQERLRISGKRKEMLRHKTFEDWAEGPCHELSRRIIRFVADRGCDTLEWAIDGGDLPWHQVKFQVEYKGKEFGIQVVEPHTLHEKTTKGDMQCVSQTKKAIREVKKAAALSLKS